MSLAKIRMSMAGPAIRRKDQTMRRFILATSLLAAVAMPAIAEPAHHHATKRIMHSFQALAPQAAQQSAPVPIAPAQRAERFCVWGALGDC